MQDYISKLTTVLIQLLSTYISQPTNEPIKALDQQIVGQLNL